ncbi:MAG TPA: ABC transporter substrate-binding protein, partial [Solirubrobacteraceae bacterium]|nr:ABC transporter substrate-binding protein [Solirubrobacteraceae bacterium]
RLVAIGALVRGPLDAIISLAPHTISSPAQLIGKTVATTGTALAAAELAAYLGKANVPPARVHTITTASPTTALIEHRAAAAVGALWNYGAVALTLAHRRNDAIPVDRAGVPSFTQLAIVVRVGEARRQGPLLRAFLQSLTRGERAVRADPAGAVATLTAFNPSLGRRFELAVLAATIPVSSPAAPGEPFGYQSPIAWRRFGEWMQGAGLLHNAANAGLAITNEFLPGQGE